LSRFYYVKKNWRVFCIPWPYATKSHLVIREENKLIPIKTQLCRSVGRIGSDRRSRKYKWIGMRNHIRFGKGSGSGLRCKNIGSVRSLEIDYCPFNLCTHCGSPNQTTIQKYRILKNTRSCFHHGAGLPIVHTAFLYDIHPARGVRHVYAVSMGNSVTSCKNTQPKQLWILPPTSLALLGCHVCHFFARRFLFLNASVLPAVQSKFTSNLFVVRFIENRSVSVLVSVSRRALAKYDGFVRPWKWTVDLAINFEKERTGQWKEFFYLC
jgi:hypothetical protein